MVTARSRAYPGIPVSEAVEKLQQLSKKLGSAPTYNRETFAVGMGYKGSNNGAFLRAVAALQQYGLVQKSGTGYALTAMAQKILFPTTSEDRIMAIKSAALNPSLFDQLYIKYQGQELPDLLPNILVNDFGILPGVKDKAASLFRASMEFAGLLDGNRLRPEVSERSSASPGEAQSKGSIEGPDQQDGAGDMNTAVPMTTLSKNFGDNRIARLAIPSDITDEEREKLVTLIENM